MAQSRTQNLIHLVFSTKNRQRFLQRQDIRNKLHNYIGGVLRNWECPAVEINSVADHIHMLFALNKKHALARIVEEVKKSSSAWIKTKDSNLASFYWQAGYAAFSVSQSKVPDVRNYIKNQAEHHRELSYQEEYRRMLARHGLEVDERYAWD